MKQENVLWVAVLSTFAVDKLYYAESGIRKSQIGGPAFFIENVFKKERVPFSLKAGNRITVDILINKKGEFGKISNKPKKRKIIYSKRLGNHLVISTICDEIDLNGIEKYSGKIFLDIQGFVRDGSCFGKRKCWELDKKYWDCFFCIKGTKEELKFLPEGFIVKQKNKLLISTKSEKGVDMFFLGKKYSFPIAQPLKTKNTIGAGDTFFAQFVCQNFRGKDILESIKIAQERTKEFLSFRNLEL